MEQYGSRETYNVEGVLRTNILQSEYYKSLHSLDDFFTVVDEIYNEVEHCEPWMSGNARGASTCFCLLYKLFTMKISEQYVRKLLDHGDSPYIRVVGFLYLRYVADPKTIYQWVEPYLDDEEVRPDPGTLSRKCKHFLSLFGTSLFCCVQ